MHYLTFNIYILDWTGCDISRSMMNEAIADNGGVGSLETTGDFVKTDIGMGLPFRPGTFDGVISVSAIQVRYTVPVVCYSIRLYYLYIYIYISK